MQSDSLPEFLLDTHAWIWLATGTNDIGEQPRKDLEAASVDGRLFVSVISVWEVAVLVSKGRLILHMPTRVWVEQALALTGIQMVSLDPDIAVESSELPDLHGDPADHILAASARLRSLTLVTRDAKLLSYARAGHMLALQL